MWSLVSLPISACKETWIIALKVFADLKVLRYFCTELYLFQFYPIYKEVKNSKDTGSFEDFIECLKLYDKMENGTMMLGELEHILLSLGQ